MTCLGDRNDATFYSASYPSGELELYPFMEPLPDSWCVIEWPGHAVISPSDLQAALIHGKHLGDFLFGWLTHGSQNQWLRPLLKPPTSTATTTHHTREGIGRRFKQNLTTFGAMTFFPPPQRVRVHLLEHPPPVMVNISAASEFIQLEYSLVTNSPLQLLGRKRRPALRRNIL